MNLWNRFHVERHRMQYMHGLDRPVGHTAKVQHKHAPWGKTQEHYHKVRRYVYTAPVRSLVCGLLLGMTLPTRHLLWFCVCPITASLSSLWLDVITAILGKYVLCFLHEIPHKMNRAETAVLNTVAFPSKSSCLGCSGYRGPGKPNVNSRLLSICMHTAGASPRILETPSQFRLSD